MRRKTPPKTPMTRIQVSRMSDEEITHLLTTGSAVEIELAIAEARRRAYIAKYGDFIPERMSPWAVEKREEVFGYRPRLGPRRTRHD